MASASSNSMASNSTGCPCQARCCRGAGRRARAARSLPPRAAQGRGAHGRAGPLLPARRPVVRTRQKSPRARAKPAASCAATAPSRPAESTPCAMGARACAARPPPPPPSPRPGPARQPRPLPQQVRLVEGTHAHRPLDGGPAAADGKPAIRLARDRHHAQIKLRRVGAVHLQLTLAGAPAQLEGGEVEIGIAHGPLDLDRLAAGDENLRAMRGEAMAGAGPPRQERHDFRLRSLLIPVIDAGHSLALLCLLELR